MRVTYDADALFVRLVDEPITDSSEVAPGLIIDFDSVGRPVGIEILHARATLPGLDLSGVIVASIAAA